MLVSCNKVATKVSLDEYNTMNAKQLSVLHLSFGMDTKPILAHLFNIKSIGFHVISVSCSFGGMLLKSLCKPYKILQD